MAQYFDYLSKDTYFGEKTWEKAESTMLKKCFDLSLQKSGFATESLDYIFSGDLLNQCVGSAFGIKDSNVPYFGLYGACSTMAESMTLAAMSIDGGYAQLACAITSSHFCSAERQYRFPLNYGGLRTPTSQWTATASGAVIMAAKGNGPAVTHLTVGKIVDGGVTDANNMGAAMAPAALETICNHFNDTGRTPDYYDAVITGDLGTIGSDILREMCRQNGFDIESNHYDCGKMIYDLSSGVIDAGGSGCGCGASILTGFFLPKLRSGEMKRILFAATGALMSPVTTMQSDSILGICHAVAIENMGGAG